MITTGIKVENLRVYDEVRGKGVITFMALQSPFVIVTFTKNGEQSNTWYEFGQCVGKVTG